MSGLRRSKRLLGKEEEDGFDIDLELSDRAKEEIQKIVDDENNNPVTDEQWILFFCEYLLYIENNISLCLSKIPELQYVSINDLINADLNEGGFDKAFDIPSDIQFNIQLYYALFTQIRDRKNEIVDCRRLNLLLSYVGSAVILIGEQYNKISSSHLTNFLRKIVVILELSVFQQVFLLYMTGDSTGNTHRVDFEHHHDFLTHRWYIGIWIRKQEFLGVLTRKGKHPRKKYDNGLRLFVRNFLNRIILYMRKYCSNYPLGHIKPYEHSCNIKKVERDPLPYKAVPQVSTRMEYYYISRADWDYIPNFLLPASAEEESLSSNKEKKHPSEWNNKPDQWWIDRIEDKKGLLGGFTWWESGTDVNEFEKRLKYTKELAKWLAINGTLPEQYEEHSKLWDADFEEAGAKPVKYAKVSTSAKVAKLAKFGGISAMKQKKSSSKKEFKILSDKYITLDPQTNEVLKNILDMMQYFKFTNATCARTSDERIFNDNIYTNKLNSSVILYNTDKKIIRKAVKKTLPPSKKRVERAVTR